MQHLAHSRFLSYGVAVIAVILALGFMLMLDPWLSMVRSPFILFWGAIMIAAWHGGLKPGLLATLISGLLSSYFFIEPRYSFSLSFGDWLRVGFYVLQGGLMSVICEALRNAKSQAEANLLRFKVSEERFRLALSNSNIYIFQQDRDLNYLWIHTPQGEILPEKILRQSDHELFFLLESQQLTAIKHRAIETGKPVREEVCISLKDKFYCYDLWVQPIQRAEKKINRITCVAVNITERKQIEKQLQLATEQSTQILETITDAFFALDTSWQFTYINRHFEQLTQQKKEDLLNHCIWDVLPETVKSVFYEDLNLAFREKEAVTVETISPLNPSQWIEVRAYPSLEGLSIYWQDITERKQAEIERIHLLEREKRARTEAELMQQRLSFLDRVSSILSASLDYEITLKSVVEVMVPDLADVCGLDILPADRSINPLMALKAQYQEEEELIRNFTNCYPLDLNNINHPITKVFNTGLPEVLYEVTEDHYHAIAQNPEHLDYLQQLKIKSVICVPLIAHEQVFGVMTLMITRRERRYTDDDLILALELGRRVGGAIENSTLHRQLQQATRKQQESLALLNAWLASSPVGLAFVNTDLRYIYVNQALAKINEVEISHHIGRTVGEIEAEYAGQIAPIFEQVMLSKQPLLNQELSSQREGVTHCSLVNYYPVCLEDGQVLGVGVTVVNVSELKQAEIARTQLLEKLEAKHKLLEAVIEQMPAGIAMVEAESGQILLHNEQLHQILEHQPLLSEQSNKDRAFYQAYRPTGEIYQLEELPLVRSRQTGEIVRSEEICLVWPEGKSKTVLVDSRPIYKSNGQIEVAVATFYDITELQKQKEQIQRYADIVTNVQIGICVWQLENFEDPGSLRLVSANLAASQIMGFDFAPLIGQTMAESFPSFMETDIPQRYAEVIKTGLGKTLEDFYYGDETIPAGTFSIKAFPLPNHCLGLAFENITERKIIEEKLRESESRLILAHKIGKIGTFEWNLLSNKIIWTEEMEVLYDIAPGSFDGTYETWLNKVHPEDRQEVSLAVEVVLAQGSDFSPEFRIVLSDGRIRWIAAKAVVKRDKRGNIERLVGVNMDITDYKQVVLELRNREEQLRLAVQGANLGMWDYNLLTGELIWSNDCKKLFGLSPETQMSYEIFLEALAPEDRSRVYQAVDRAIAQQENYDVEMRTLWPDGSLHWVRSIGQAYYNHEGVAYRMAGVVLNITEQKQAQEALRKSEERFRVAQELSLDAFTVLKSIRSETGKIVDFEWSYVNPTAAKILKTTVEELTGKHLLKVLPGNKTDGELFERYVRVVETGEPHDLELYYHSDEIVGWFRNMAVKLEDGVAISFSDITERKQAEEKLRENEQRLDIALRTAKLGSWQLDLSTLEIDSSPQCLANFGLPADARLSYSEFLELIHPEDRDYVFCHVQEAIRTHTNYEAEYRNVWPDGSIHWISAQGCVLYSDKGTAVRMIGVTLDITVRKQAEAEQEQVLERLIAARTEAERVNRIKDEFLAVLSHELRSPLNPILGWAQLLRMNSFDKTNQDRALEIIERNAKLQAQLIEDLLDVSRILRGKLSLTVAPVNLVLPISGAIETVRLSAEAKSIEIKTDLSADVGKIAGDAGRIQQIVWNLLTNAIKFTPSGGQIELSLEQVNDQAQITVKDTGKGIDPSFLPYVFEHFRQADSTTTRNFGGLGLGLAIVRHLVEMHGGTVTAESAGEHLGATFRVQLPRLKDEAHSITEDADSPVSSLCLSPLEGIRILTVDDDPDMRDYVAFVLRQAGAEVKVAASANQALKILPQFQPDVLVSDIGMPKVDGYMLLRQIRGMLPKNDKTLLAVALTAYAGEYDQQLAQKAGYHRHVSKPVEPQQLINAIEELLKSNHPNC